MGSTITKVAIISCLVCLAGCGPRHVVMEGQQAHVLFAPVSGGERMRQVEVAGVGVVWETGSAPYLTGTLSNLGRRPVKKVKVTVYFLGRDGTPIADDENYPVIVLQYDFGKKPIRSGGTAEFEYKIIGVPPVEWSGKTRAAISEIEFKQ